MQGDGYTIPGKRWYDSSLIADAIESILGRAAEVTIWNMRDGDRLVQERFCALKSHCEMRTLLLHHRKQALPAKTCADKVTPLHNTAKIRDAVLHRLDTTVAPVIECQFRGVRQIGGLCSRKSVVHLEGYPFVLILRSTVPAKIMLTCSEEGSWSLKNCAVVQRSLPEVITRTAERLYTSSALDADARRNSLGNQSCIKGFPGKRGCGERQRSLCGAPCCSQANSIDWHGAKRRHINAQRMQVLKSFSTQEFSTNLMTWRYFTFNKSYTSALAG